MLALGPHPLAPSPCVTVLLSLGPTIGGSGNQFIGGRGERPTRMASDLGEPFGTLRAVSNVEPLGRAVSHQH